MKHLFGSKTKDGDGLVVHGGHRRDGLKSNFGNQIYAYCKKKWHIEKDCNKLQNTKNLAANPKRRQSLGKANVVEDYLSGGDILWRFQWGLDSGLTCAFHKYDLFIFLVLARPKRNPNPIQYPSNSHLFLPVSPFESLSQTPINIDGPP